MTYKLALIDGDVLLYQFGSATDDEGHPLKWPFVQQRLDAKIHGIQEKLEAEDYEIYLTGDNNFRKTIATIKPYKGNRNQEKPFWYAKVKEYLLSSKKHRTVLCDYYEADDGMAITQYAGLHEDKSTIICTPDKDLRMVPGWHYRWSTHSLSEIEPFYVEKNDGLKWFFTQCLTGDATDNILGLYGVGKVKAEKALDGLTEPLDWYSVVRHEYKCRFGNYWQQFLHENARLLWMWRELDDDVTEWLNELEDELNREVTF